MPRMDRKGNQVLGWLLVLAIVLPGLNPPGAAPARWDAGVARDAHWTSVSVEQATIAAEGARKLGLGGFKTAEKSLPMGFGVYRAESWEQAGFPVSVGGIASAYRHGESTRAPPAAEGAAR